MSRKTHAHRCSHAKRSPKRKSNHVHAPKRKYDWRTKILAGAVAFVLLAGGILAYWKTTSDEGLIAKNTSSPTKKTPAISAASASELAEIPPEALHPQPPMIDAGYNAHNGGLPPGALPPGVVLPGMPMMQGGRTTAQGYGVPDGVRQQFTGKERDTETGLDYFGARYYSSTQGRFTSVDPENAGANPSDPQSWNAYAYARNNPLKYVDPDGRKYVVCDANGKNCVNMSDEDFYKARRAGVAEGERYTGSRDFYERGQVYVNGELFYNYRQVSIDDPQREFIFQMRQRSEAVEPLMKGMFAYMSIFTLPAGGGGRLTSLGLGTAATATSETAVASTVAPQAVSAIRNALSGFTKHGINSAISHDGVGVSTRAILETLKNPIKVIAQSGGRVKIVGKDATVILNQGGKVITTWARNSGGTRIP